MKDNIHWYDFMYFQNGIQDVVFLILDNVSQKTIPSLISGFLKKFCTEHFLELDSLLSQYISVRITKYITVIITLVIFGSLNGISIDIV